MHLRLYLRTKVHQNGSFLRFMQIRPKANIPRDYVPKPWLSSKTLKVWVQSPDSLFQEPHISRYAMVKSIKMVVTLSLCKLGLCHVVFTSIIVFLDLKNGYRHQNHPSKSLISRYGQNVSKWPPFWIYANQTYFCDLDLLRLLVCHCGYFKMRWGEKTVSNWTCLNL